MFDFMSKSLEYMWLSMFAWNDYVFSLNGYDDSNMLGLMSCHVRWMLGWLTCMLGNAMPDECLGLWLDELLD